MHKKQKKKENFSPKKKHNVQISKTKRGSYKVIVDNKKATKISESTRFVYKAEDLVIKLEIVPLNGNHRGYQSYYELYNWNKITKKDKKYFAPLIDYGTIFLPHELEIDKSIIVLYTIHKYVQRDKKKIPTEDQTKTILNVASKYDIGDLGIQDYVYKNPNWFITKDNEPIIVDYAY